MPPKGSSTFWSVDQWKNLFNKNLEMGLNYVKMIQKLKKYYSVSTFNWGFGKE